MCPKHTQIHRERKTTSEHIINPIALAFKTTSEHILNPIALAFGGHFEEVNVTSLHMSKQESPAESPNLDDVVKGLKEVRLNSSKEGRPLSAKKLGLKECSKEGLPLSAKKLGLKECMIVPDREIEWLEVT